MTAFPARQEQLRQVASTNDVVRGWLSAGTPEVCVAVADEQTAGRGRAGRTWMAPPGAALLLSIGFRPTWLDPGRAWQLAAIVSLAMVDASERAGGLPDGTVRLKWPNDLVIEGDPAKGLAIGAATGGPPATGAPAAPGSPAPVLKLGGVLGESDGLGTIDPRVVVGIGVNAGWARAAFPPNLAPAMTSLDEATGGQPIDRTLILETFLEHLEWRLDALRGGSFPIDDWVARQVTTGRLVLLDGHGREREEVRAVGLDPETGALLVADPAMAGGERAVHAGEIVRLRLAAGTASTGARALDGTPPAVATPAGV